MKRLFSGIQPTGVATLGNYLGAIKRWQELQTTYDSMFCIVDLHAITGQFFSQINSNKDSLCLNKQVMLMMATLMACQIDPKNIFVQSSNPHHVELMWILSGLTPFSWLQRMTQFKDKKNKNYDNTSVGLFTYPILMAADILLYDSDVVPVGDDQLQHLELTRNIAQSFNVKLKENIFKLPIPLVAKDVARIMSLRDAKQKMSKSDISDLSRINLNDEDKLILKKISKAKTDSLAFPSEQNELEGRAEVKNLMTIFKAISKNDFTKQFNTYGGKNFSSFKKDLAELLINEISPIRMAIQKYLSDESYLADTIASGAKRAKSISEIKMHKIKKVLGF